MADILELIKSSVDLYSQSIRDLQSSLINEIRANGLSAAEKELASRFTNTINWYVSKGSFDIQREVLELLSKLRPHRAKSFSKARLGSAHDGGYIMLDDFAPTDIAFSFGVEQNADWDLEMVKRGLKVRQYDHSIDKPPVDHPMIVWEKKKISPYSDADNESIATLVERFDEGSDKPNLILKMDIEGSEWDVINATDIKRLRRFRQIVCELHSFDYLGERWFLDKVKEAIGKLAATFKVVHVHANNYCGFANVSGVMVPMVLEVTFVNTACYDLEVSDEIFPTILDRSCDQWRPDLYLGNFAFEAAVSLAK